MDEKRIQGGDPVGISRRSCIHTKLDWMGYRVVEKAWQYVQPFWYNTSMWRTDRQTDRQKAWQPNMADARNERPAWLTDNKSGLVITHRHSSVLYRSITSNIGPDTTRMFNTRSQKYTNTRKIYDTRMKRKWADRNTNTTPWARYIRGSFHK